MLSFDRAYHVATPGAVVQVAGGAYPAQAVKADATKTAPPIVFEPAPGEQVTVDGSLACRARTSSFRT